MHSTTAFAVAAALFSSVGLAAPTSSERTFNLVVNSRDGSGKYENAPISADHSGAGIEALAQDAGYSSPFSFNATSQPPVYPGDTSPGYLVFSVNGPSSNFKQELQLLQNASSNVGAGFFGIGSGPILVSFNNHNKLGRILPDYSTEYNWFLCPQTFEAYEYNTVSFVHDGETPSNPDCAPVDVIRV